MRPKHTQHTLPTFPVYSSAFLSATQLVLGGGGGASKTGIKNKIRLYEVSDDRNIELKNEFELEKGEDAPMSIAAHTKNSHIICGINSSLEQIEKGENLNCRAFGVRESKIQLLGTKGTLTVGDTDDFQKVTVLSPDGALLVAAGSHDLNLLSYPSLQPVAEPIHTEKEIYDATFSDNTLVVATTHQLLVYSLPEASEAEPNSTSSSKKNKKTTQKVNGTRQSLNLVQTLNLPSTTGEGSTFRAARYHPLDHRVLYTIVNTSPPRSRKSKTTSRQAFVLKWNTVTWTLEKMRKIGDRGVTCFDISVDGRFLGFGSSDLAIGMLDSKTLSPLMTILKAHEFPSTTIRFNSSTTLLVSGSADNSVRVISIPSNVGGSSWSIIILVLTILILLLAVAVNQYGGPGGIQW
ncbi:hypothetical protein D9619_000869 [Psilocybe cf. subviscida]|uniref:WD40 repeat-like protein n=1 Tax=Psilocybe cf. subviscida TaxID=2480587 RepID=A0A8H5F3V0_9AGAR|nr:hypothetical protein D9619_000869 [Psilocybe cf. subviscida]